MKTACVLFGAFAISASLAPLSVPAFSQSSAIPDRFHGLWQITEEGLAPSCAPIDADIRMEVTSERIDFHEGGCDVVSIDELGADGAATMDLVCWQEGEEWKDRQVWALVQDVERTALSVTRQHDEFNVTYGQCGRTTAASQEAKSYCYDDGRSSLKITVLDKSEVRFEVDSVQGNAHMCGLAGVATVVSGGIRYSESIAGIGQCRLDIQFSEDRSVHFEDPDWICKRQYCGARAAFEHIQLSGRQGQDC